MADESPETREFKFEREWLDLESPPDTDLVVLYEFWKTMAEAEGIPRRRWFSAESLRRFLPRVLIIQVEQGGESFSYRLAGSQVYEVHGYEFTGRNVRDISPQALGDALHDDFRMLVQSKSPQLGHMQYTNRLLETRSYLMLRLPLSEDGETVSQILACGDYSAIRQESPTVSLDVFLNRK